MWIMAEAVDPICLNVKLVDACECHCGSDDPCDVPTFLNDYFGDELVVGGDCKRLFATLGQFSIVRLERDSQLLIPSFDFCIPNKECLSSNNSAEDSACDLFRKIKFPVDQFFPPNIAEEATTKAESSERGCGCGCK
ncbi:MAG: hypothetical protein RSA70_03085 [Clostridia bacterium]